MTAKGERQDNRSRPNPRQKFMPPDDGETMADAVERWIEAQGEWLEPDGAHAISVNVLRRLARTSDEHPGLVTAAAKLHEVSRHLLKDNPPEEEQEPSPLQNILAQVRQLRDASGA